jgi:Protein of unknown function (DUF1565)
MLRSFVLLAGGLGLSCFGFFACSSSSKCDGAASCGAPVDAGADVDSGPVCAPDADPKDQPECLDDAFGVFVDKDNGSDTNPGTKAAPFQTVATALAKLGDKQRVFLCEGNYFEHVTLTRPISVHGGFACKTWSYTGAKARFAPNDGGYILQVSLVTEPLMVTDLTLEAVNAQTPGAPSITAFVTRSAKVSFRRMSINAGAGASALAGENAQDYAPAVAPDGYAGDATDAGKGRQNPGCTTSIGGAGGKDGATSGRPGQVSIVPSFPEANTGEGGTAGAACTAGGAGGNGSFGAGGAAGAGAPELGILDTVGWKATAGAVGGRGGDGQGGGGGGQLNPLGIGGGGGPGGCGGAGGAGGGAGGSSIALLVYDSVVMLEGSSLSAKDGGAGGAGGKGQKAQLASTKIAGPSSGADACSGGVGGIGGSGGGGGGGAGGLSVGILYKGTAPTIDGTAAESVDTLPTITLGAPGAGGAAGAGGDAAQTTASASKAGADGTAGPNGVAKGVFRVE